MYAREINFDFRDIQRMTAYNIQVVIYPIVVPICLVPSAGDPSHGLSF